MDPNGFKNWRYHGVRCICFDYIFSVRIIFFFPLLCSFAFNFIASITTWTSSLLARAVHQTFESVRWWCQSIIHLNFIIIVKIARVCAPIFPIVQTICATFFLKTQNAFKPFSATSFVSRFPFSFCTAHPLFNLVHVILSFSVYFVSSNSSHQLFIWQSTHLIWNICERV